MPSHDFTNTTFCGIFLFMTSPNIAPNDRFNWELHVESHARMHNGDPRSFAELSLAEKLGRGALLGCVALPDVVAEIREELIVFQSELDFSGLAEDR